MTECCFSAQCVEHEAAGRVHPRQSTEWLYVGVKGDLVKRVWQHKNDVAPGFTKKYNVHTLVYFELHGDMMSAITREKQIKKWNRAWKLRLIEERNPLWEDLYPSIL